MAPELAVIGRKLALASVLLLASGCASGGDARAAPEAKAAAAASAAFPREIVQGSLLRAAVDPGSRLELLSPGGPAVPVRVAPDGGFVIGVGRDETGPLRLRVLKRGGSVELVQIAVQPRKWQLERIEGVPEATVNPPPEIAARIQREQALVNAARKRDDARDDWRMQFEWPLQGRLSGVFGSQRIYNGTPKSPHSGLDVAAPAGTPVRAPAAGIVTLAEPDLYLTGGTVLLDHGHGVSSNFLHFSRIDVRAGERVEQGQVLGLVGMTGRATGPHMHWGMNWFGVRVDPRVLLPATPPAKPSASAAPSR